MTTATMTVAEAEAKLRGLVRENASQAAIDEAHDELDAARAVEAQTATRTVQRERIKQELRKEDLAEQRRAREKRAHDAEVKVLKKPPVVTLEYAGVKVRIELVGGRDFGARPTCVEAITRAIRVLGGAHVEMVAAA